jgi:hypothetical protein
MYHRKPTAKRWDLDALDFVCARITKGKNNFLSGYQHTIFSTIFFLAWVSLNASHLSWLICALI